MQTTVTASDGKLIGYARVSTVDQNLALQMDELKSAGCCEILAVLGGEKVQLGLANGEGAAKLTFQGRRGGQCPPTARANSTSLSKT